MRGVCYCFAYEDFMKTYRNHLRKEHPYLAEKHINFLQID